MGALRFDWTFFRVLIAAAVLVNAVVFLVAYATRFYHFARENGPLEICQVLVLAVAAMAFSVLFLRVRHAERLIACGAASLCLLFIFRELEIPASVPVLHFMASSPKFLYLLAVVLGLHALVQFYFNWPHVPAFFGWLVRLEWWPFLFAGLLLLAADALEGFGLTAAEEITELNSYVVLATVAGIALYRVLKRSY